QVAVHAIGDAAIEQALRAWERVYGSLDSRGRRHFRARRHRIEHFELPGHRQVERAAALGLAISVQPAFDAEWGHPGQLYEMRLGPDRAARMNPFWTLLGRGLEVGAGSDSPVTPLDPMYGLWSLENHHDAGQRMSREEAIRLFTIGSAPLATSSTSWSSAPNPSSMKRLWSRARLVTARDWSWSESASASARDARNVSPPDRVRTGRRSSPFWPSSTKNSSSSNASRYRFWDRNRSRSEPAAANSSRASPWRKSISRSALSSAASAW